MLGVESFFVWNFVDWEVGSLFGSLSRKKFDRICTCCFDTC